MRRRLTPMLVVTIAASLMMVTAPSGLASDRFEDVPDDNIFHGDIMWLAEEDITRGCNPPDNDLFCPDDNVTRGQMAAFFVRALELMSTEGGTDFTDTDDSIFEQDILRLSAADITRGCNPPDNDEFCPNENVTRGQMAAFFVRALDLTSTEGGTDFTDTDDSIFEQDILRLSAAGITRGCNPPDNDRFCPDDFVTREQMAAFFHRALGGSLDLTIAHVNDVHSHLEPNGITINIGGAETDVVAGGYARIATKFSQIEADHENVLKVNAGDQITGTLFWTLFEGEADAAVMNEVCFDVYELGNHAFDAGDAVLADFLDLLKAGDCDTAVLGANIVPEVGTPLAPQTETDYIQPYTIERYNGKTVGIIGIEIADKTRNSSQPLESTQFLDEVETAQKYVDQLEGMGVDRIVVASHYQYQNELALAQAVDGVDVVVGGDSHTLLGDEFSQYGFTPAGPYPTTDAGGEPVCVVQAWQYSNVVGELNVTWDEDGNLTNCGGTPTLLLGDTFTREEPDPENPDEEIDVPLEGEELQAVLDEIEQADVLEIVEPDSSTAAVIDSFADEVEELQQQVIGIVPENLCAERIPGQDVNPLCPAEATAEHGGDIQQLVTEAFRVRSFESDIAIQNAGGVRVPVPAGEYTIADAYELLPFANTMVNIEMTGEEVVQVLNDAYQFAVVEGTSDGAYPYGAGIRWTTNFEEDVIEDVEVKLKGETTWSPIDPAAMYTVVTNSFVASGQDGYDTFGAIPDERKTDTLLDYAQTFIDYIEEDLPQNAEGLGIMNKVPVEEYSTHNIVGSYTP